MKELQYEGVYKLMDNPNKKSLNPWFSMWIKPRETIQQIVNSKNPQHLVGTLVMLAGFSRALDRASNRNLGDSMELYVIILFAIFTGIVVGTLSLAIGSSLIRWTGKWLGGQSSSDNIRAAMAWSYVPVIWALAFWGIELIVFGKELFTSETPILDSSPSMLYLYLGLTTTETIIAIWAIVIFILCLGKVQAFSIWKALANIILAALAFLIPLMILVFGFLAFSSH